MQGDMHRVEILHVARDAAAQGDLRVTRRYRTAKFHFQLSRYACTLQAAREHPIGEFVDERADDAAVQGLYPTVVVNARRPGGYDLLAVFPEFQMQADGIRRAATEAVVTFFVKIWIDQFIHH